MNKHDVVAQIQSQLADADIRSDQCGIVRVYWRGRFAFVREVEDLGIEVAIELRPAPDTPDFEPYPYIREITFTEPEAATKLVHWLKRIEATDIDSPSEWQS